MHPIKARNPSHALNTLGSPEFAGYPTEAGAPANAEGGRAMKAIPFDQIVDLLCTVCADYAQSL